MILYLFYFIIGLFLLYLLAIMPRIKKREGLDLFQQKYYAHRGFHTKKAVAPENSIKAFKQAVEFGYGIELDVQLSKDRVPVVFHDYNLKRVCGIEKKVNELTYDELSRLTLYQSKERIPKFSEVLALVDGKVPLIVEHKVEDKDLSVCEVVAPMLDQYKGGYCIESFNPLCLIWYKKYRPVVIRGQLASNLVKEEATKSPILSFILQNLLLNFLTKPDFVAFRHRDKKMLSFTINRVLYRVTTFAWTIKSKEDLEANYNEFDYFIFERFHPEDTCQ